MSPLHACFLLCEKKAKRLSHRVVSLTDLSAVAINNPTCTPPTVLLTLSSFSLQSTYHLLAQYIVSSRFCCLSPPLDCALQEGRDCGPFLRASVAMATRTLQDVNPPLLGQERRMGCGFRNGGPFTPSKDCSFSGTQ